MKPKVLLIVGPTAVGKTALSLELAQRFGGEVISGDSMQVYRHLDIGTAKATPAEQRVVPHHLIDIVAVTDRYSVADFMHEATCQINAITARGHLPLLVGGTGFYLQALVDNLTLGNDHYTDDTIRQKWHTYAAAHGRQALWDQLNAVDPPAATKIPPNNERRVIRALEVYERTGQRFSAQQANAALFDPYIIGLTTAREVLYARINARVDAMVKAGLVDEARWLYEQGGANLPAGKGIGYKELYPYFAGQDSLEDAVALIKRNSRRYAKRQLTWFRNQMTVHWYDLVAHPEQQQQIEVDVKQWLQDGVK
ncbi:MULTISPECIES: tRNA (adenosine(37)-N6)-dimethylallyltransferase MiaA [unclassified Ligilactobacillus]|uniref:tRNA (adenosine(37)-N6)-dimethylallyltransferase MiaA n=1 Tax=unclassified Ligilactobacillus TaxID=2767920 RepID=UPI0038525E9F